MAINKGEITNTNHIYDGRVVSLRVDTVEKSDGSKVVREIVERSDCIAVVVVDEQDRVILVRQPREAIGKSLLEIPAGGIDAGETPLEAVNRELQEEIGYAPQSVQHLGGFYASPGYCTEYLYLYLATNLVPAKLHAEDTEDIEIVRVPVSKIPALITSGEMCDAKSVAGLLRFMTEKRS